uniref:Uncharacterized protein n=1 Tax=Panagrolaimus sp. ES5 TaxID=591445 RepID=A0AC34G501_9BILA
MLADSYFAAVWFCITTLKAISPFFKLETHITVTMDLEDVGPSNLYSAPEKTEASKILKNDQFSLMKNEQKTIYYDFVIPTNLPNLLSQNVTFHGSLNLRYGESEDEMTEFVLPLDRKHTFEKVPEIKEDNNNIKNKFKDFFQPFLPYSTEMKKLYTLIIPSEAKKYEKKICQLYFSNNHSELIQTVDLYFKNAINFEWFLQSCDTVETTVSIFEQNIIEKQKNVIFDILFIKGDTILDEILKNECLNIPTIFKERFGFECFKKKLHLEKPFGYVFKNVFFNIFYTVKKDNDTNRDGITVTDKIKDTTEKNSENPNDTKVETLTCKKCSSKNLMVSNKCDSNEVSISSENNDAAILNQCESCKCGISADIPQIDNDFPQITNQISSQSQKQLEKACEDFLKHGNQNDVRKDLIEIKKAIIFGNFETALFHLNKISTKNQTNPDFEFVDFPIIE